MGQGFKSHAQIRKFYELHAKGKVGAESIALRALHTAGLLEGLPEHVERKTHPNDQNKDHNPEEGRSPDKV